MEASRLSSKDVATVAAVLSWTTSSVGMMVFNKLAISAFPAECTLTAIQMVATVVLLLLFARKSVRIGSSEDVLRWCLVVPFFVGMLLTSLLALKEAPMSLVIAFRGTSPILALSIERLYPNPLKISVPMLVSMFAMCFGVALYCHDLHLAESWTGIAWVFLNSILAVGDRLVQRYLLAKEHRPVDISTAGVAVLNNGLSLVPIAAAVLATGEYSKVGALVARLDGAGVAWVLASCVAGCGISFTGIWVTSLISATSFLVLINTSKFAVLLLEVFFMKTKHPLTQVQIAGVIVIILAGAIYGKARRDVEEQCNKAESLPIVGKAAVPPRRA